jgi:hypothetical protein
MALRGDIYSKGSWGVKLFTNYKVRYKYGGQMSARFARNYNGDRELPTSTIVNGYSFKWTHIQDAKFNPSVQFSANVNINSSSYNQYNSTIANDYLSNTFQSNVSWRKTWKFGSFSTNLTHSQNTLTHNVDIGFPNATFLVNRFYPFRNPERVGKAKWWDKIGMSYTSEFRNALTVIDSTLQLQRFGDAVYMRENIYRRKHLQESPHRIAPADSHRNVIQRIEMVYAHACRDHEFHYTVQNHTQDLGPGNRNRLHRHRERRPCEF